MSVAKSPKSDKLNSKTSNLDVSCIVHTQTLGKKKTGSEKKNH